MDKFSACRLLYQMSWRIPVRSGIVHMHMDVAAYPLGRFVWDFWAELHRETGSAAGFHFDVALFETELKAVHDIDLNCSRRHR